MKLISLLPLNLREAEKEETDTSAEEGGEEKNPFAASEEGGGEEEETDAADTDASKEGGEEEEGGEESTDGGKPLDVVFNPSRVRKYNDIKFKENRGTVVGISRFGITVKLPDEQTVFVNFEDIL